jgi:hypothetical protein
MKVNVKYTACSINEDVWGSGGYLGTRWKSVVSFTPLPLYDREKSSSTNLVGSRD